MATQFERTARGRLKTTTEPAERTMLSHLLEELCGLLDTGEPEDVEADPLARALGLTDLARQRVDAPTDPVLLRLLPDGYSGDDEAANEFRRYTDATLRAGKIADARAVREALGRADAHAKGKLVLTEDEAQVWLRAFNDLRLALGIRLGVTALGLPKRGESDQKDDHADVSTAIYDFLTWWQDSLVAVLLADS